MGNNYKHEIKKNNFMNCCGLINLKAQMKYLNSQKTMNCESWYQKKQIVQTNI